ncbi:MAG: nitroreductase family protein [bacterium]
MQLDEAIRKRRSIRKFQDRNIDREIIENILSSALEAPSAGNLQPWKIFVFSKNDEKEEIAMIAYNQRFISEASYVIVIIADTRKSSSIYGSRGRDLYAIQDTSALIQNILLLAVDKGLGTCWVGAFDEEKLTKFLNLPNGQRPVAIIPIGYPAENPPHRGRDPLRSLVKWF